MGVDDNRDAHLATHHTEHRHCVPEAPNPPAHCFLLTSEGTGQVGVEKGSREGVQWGEHTTQQLLLLVFPLQEVGLSKNCCEESQRVEQVFLHHLVCFPCNKNLGGYEALALPLSYSPSPAPSLLNALWTATSSRFFPIRKLNGKRKKQQRAVTKH